ncbi:site-specific integrase [Nocardia abscessus]|uniref:site-specific integrase n=1 Tax=Nocardia abscessus TaxID=120957 RepID=UPI0014616A01|nr:site-specific integrase [Nocardia abscessus]MCC3332263.1 site-specific integrase [Nocardia abscessus]
MPRTILDNYGPSWKVLERLWGDRLITDPTYTEIQQLVSEHQVRAAATKRSNSRGGRGAAATMVSAVRHLYRHAEHDRLIHPLDNPAAKVSKPRQPSSSRHALSLEQVHDLGHIASTTGNDRSLDAPMLRLFIETTCRRGCLVHLTLEDLNAEDCLVRLREKGGTLRWQPVSPTLMPRVLDHVQARGGPEATDRVLRYRDGRPAGRRRIDHLFTRIRRTLPWAEALGVNAQWIRHTTLIFVEPQFGIAVARAYAGHEDGRRVSGAATFTYTKAGLLDVIGTRGVDRRGPPTAAGPRSAPPVT